MLTLKLTYEEALEGLQRAVAEKGVDYVYEKPDGFSCFYFNDGAPSCGVGYLLDYNGISKSFPVSRPYFSEQYDWEGDSVEVLFRSGVLDVDYVTQVLLAKFQECQDDGESWGDALAQAIYLAEL